MENQAGRENSIIFLGTGGARFMVAKQILASGGLWLNLGGHSFLLDPGPGCLVQVNRLKLNPEDLSAIIISHRHLDHAADVNVMVEAMTLGGYRPRGRFFCPADALNGEPVLFSYLKAYLEGVDILSEGQTYQVNGVSFSTPLRHIHAAETYGMRFTAGGYTLGYVADSLYFDGLVSAYAGSDLLIINVVFPDYNHGVSHLAAPDAARLITEIKPRMAILTHFGMPMWKANPEAIAAAMSRETGVPVLAARDDMVFPLARLATGQPLD
jgi:ribonuclease BN (tRNA processing enzyme)